MVIYGLPLYSGGRYYRMESQKSPHKKTLGERIYRKTTIKDYYCNALLLPADMEIQFSLL